MYIYKTWNMLSGIIMCKLLQGIDT